MREAIIRYSEITADFGLAIGRCLKRCPSLIEYDTHIVLVDLQFALTHNPFIVDISLRLKNS